MRLGHNKAEALRARVCALWAATQRVTLLIPTDDEQWTLMGRRLVMRNLWSLPTVKMEGPLTGPDPKNLLRRMDVSRPDYVLPRDQIVRHLAYPTTIKARDLPALLQLEGSRHTAFVSERLAMSFRHRPAPAGAQRQMVSVSYCLQEELVRLREELGPCGPRRGFLAAFDAKVEDLLNHAWWQSWTAGFGLFAEENTRIRPPGLRHFLMQAALVPLAATTLICPSLVVWHTRVASRTQQIASIYHQEARPLRALRADAHTSRHLRAQLTALRVYLRHTTLLQSLLPQLTHALPASATLVGLRYDTRRRHLQLEIRSNSPGGLLEALDHATGTSWQKSGMAQPIRPGVKLLTLSARWPAATHS